jgi:hypothetical protein
MRVIELVEQPAKEATQPNEVETPKVLRALLPTERVIVTGQQRVRKGVTVNPKPAPTLGDKAAKPSAGI